MLFLRPGFVTARTEYSYMRAMQGCTELLLLSEDKDVCRSWNNNSNERIEMLSIAYNYELHNRGLSTHALM